MSAFRSTTACKTRKRGDSASDKEFDLSAIAHKSALSIDEFCALHGITRQSFWNYRNSGIAPKVMNLPGRVLISQESAAEWRRFIEANPLPGRGRPSKFRRAATDEVA